MYPYSYVLHNLMFINVGETLPLILTLYANISAHTPNYHELFNISAYLFHFSMHSACVVPVYVQSVLASR